MTLFQEMGFCVHHAKEWLELEHPGTAQLGSAEKAIMEALSVSYNPFNNSVSSQGTH